MNLNNIKKLIQYLPGVLVLIYVAALIISQILK